MNSAIVESRLVDVNNISSKTCYSKLCLSEERSVNFAKKITYTAGKISGRPDAGERKSAVAQKGILSGKHSSGYSAVFCDKET